MLHKTVLPKALIAGLVLAVASVSFLPATAVADTLLINEVSEAAETAGNRPRRGMNMDQVREQFGEPAASGKPVGDPPITRWEYRDFIVYFEYQTVLHTVATQR